MKSTLYVMFALFIDGLKAGVSWGIVTIAAFPGTFAGGVTGCLIGNAFLGKIGCWLGGATLAFFGTTLNGAAVVTIPFGVALADAICFCISITLGSALIIALLMNRMFYPKYIWSGTITGLLPPFCFLPTWTAVTLLCILEKRRQEGKRGFFTALTVLSPTSALGKVAQSITQVNQDTARMVQAAKEVSSTRESTAKRSVPTLSTIDGIRSRTAGDNLAYVQ